MSVQIIKHHVQRVWRRHWRLQIASVTVMTVVLLIMNLMFLSFSAFNAMVNQFGNGMEMVVYLKEQSSDSKVEEFKKQLLSSGDFKKIDHVTKQEATQTFLSGLGPESAALMSDSRWSSPIPASVELRLSDRIPVEKRVNSMRDWAAQLRKFDVVDDVFYGQGWIENFASFIHGFWGLVMLIWGLSVCVGLLIVGNCIRLSFMQRREEIAVLELVGATRRFIRTPFLLEGITIGALASIFSLTLSLALHNLILNWISHQWDFWISLKNISPIQGWYIVTNIFTGISFGFLGAWHCVRSLNTGWAAVE